MDFSFVDETSFGFSWTSSERLPRTSHVLCHNGRVWFVDPVDWPQATARAVSLGKPAAVVQLLDRHNRDCATLAERLRIPLHVVPAGPLEDTPFEIVSIVRWKRWREVALWWPERRALVVAEALGTTSFFTVANDEVGVHGLLKPFPPRDLLRLAPEHLLVGHGAGLHGPTTTRSMHEAIRRSRLRFIPWVATLPFSLREPVS